MLHKLEELLKERSEEKKMSELLQSIQENVVFLLEFLALICALFLVAYAAEKWAKKVSGDTERVLSTRKIAVIGVLSTISAILMLFEFPVPFAPPFYEIDFSELPALIGTFAYGPVAGVLIELCKILLKLLMKGTTTAFVGDLANFSIGCSYLLPASIIYLFKKTRKNAVVGCIAGTFVMTVVGTAFNAIYLLPKFAQLYGMPLDAIIGMGTAINPSINSVSSFVMLAVAPLNLLKGTSVSVMTLLIYKKLSPVLKTNEPIKVAKQKEKTKMTV